MAGIVVIFDFDNTILDCDGDNWVVDELGFNQLYNQLFPTMPWNSLMHGFFQLSQCLLRSCFFLFFILYTQGRINGVLMELDRMMQELHSPGITIKQIEDSSELRIVSDANPFFIKTIQKHHGLIDYFSEIITNPGFINEEGRLLIQASQFTEGEKRFIYLGDGKGDCCPSLKFGEGERQSDAKEAFFTLGGTLDLINMITIEEGSNNNSAQLISGDFKLQTIPISTHESLS
ncbi:hypothetical protein NE237_020855 [Protea cynaroides]|uniref:Uncharacterized protein n=1 Tax=Protea cynaroides TaxID=273540 RepID=A0A9Q0H819_9MAGN|nr:hypothetical protein NE237_020855 [Protea cynaroides]